MSASLVGSEMCIRDRVVLRWRRRTAFGRPPDHEQQRHPPNRGRLNHNTPRRPCKRAESPNRGKHWRGGPCAQAAPARSGVGTAGFRTA
eukprot:8417320-Alexandrium_andersonii.AAC.1